MIRLFSGANPLNIFFLFLLGILLNLNRFIYPEVPVPAAADGWLYVLVLQWLAPTGKVFPLIYPLLSYITIFIQAVVFNGMINEKRLYAQSHLLFAFSLIFLSALIPSWAIFSSSLFINSICVWLWLKWTGLYNSEHVKQDVFNMGFAAGISTFLFGPAFFFMLIVLIALLLSRPFRITEWLIGAVGFLLPFYFLAVYVYVSNQWSGWSAILPEVAWQTPILPRSTSFYITSFLILLPLLGGLLNSRSVVGRMLVHQRKIWTLNLIFLAIVIVPAFYISGNNSALLLFPVGLYLTMFFSVPRKKIIPELLVWIGFIWMVIRSNVDI